MDKNFSTGLPDLDSILQGICPGDNVVFQVDAVGDYIPFVHPFCEKAHVQGRALIYFRFAAHEYLIPKGVPAHVYEIHPDAGFEKFIAEIFDVIEKFGYGACYVFDSLSELAVDWYSDRMLGNFFMLTCPYLYTFDTVAYFGLLRNHHASYAVDAIHGTAQVVLDIYRRKSELYVYPLKVYERHSKTMCMPHKWNGDRFIPEVRSAAIAEILGSVSQPWLDFTINRYDIWARSFTKAQEIVDSGTDEKPEDSREKTLFSRLVRMVVSRDPRVLSLIEKYFSLKDVVGIGKRMIGTGLIGGKSLGMLLARSIVKNQDKELHDKLECHDSFFIGSDVFYTYIIENGCWWARRGIKREGTSFDGFMEVRQRMLSGKFPDYIKNQFTEMLDYFGQSPIIVRSSSLLEDAYGNAFSGKYESVFCANQGTPEERLEKFIEAVRIVYTSTMSKEAIAYRARWNLLDRDEQMAILVQRVSGSIYGTQYFPQVAGVGFSFNPYVWSNEIKPEEGMIRLVFGLGTRAVDRSDDDYTRLVALNAPERRPEGSLADVRKYSQHCVDVLDLHDNRYITKDFEEVVRGAPEFDLKMFASRDKEVERKAREYGTKNVFSWVLTFDELLLRTGFVGDMAKMLKILQKAYNHPVDVEFTANFLDDRQDYNINLLQCRPFQIKGNLRKVKAPVSIKDEQILLKTRGPIIGSSISTTVDRIIYVVPEVYSKMKMTDRYSVARLIGRITHLKDKGKIPKIMLIGPGRWGTTTPSLGVPVSFAEIDTVSVICEVAAMDENLIPDISLGTHFFNDLVEVDMLYFAVFPEKKDSAINRCFFNNTKNKLDSLIPVEKLLSQAVKVIDSDSIEAGRPICLNADVLEQKAICYLDIKK